ncbi:hypothetical protein [Pontibacter ruber]|uniref:Uncharacterized protein n=1 Tax=Pontibacter ruber TaxID=1343895 RepID=A0ABW5CRV6_9BACT|nr:hypothetical protein [Pontibacter ruber]
MKLDELVARLDSEATLPKGTEERFNGYGVIGITFRSGHVLALRHFAASSVGPGYTSVWHRDPEGGWEFYADAPAHLTCARFFGSAVARAVQTPIHISWSNSCNFHVSVEADALEWDVTLKSTSTTNTINRLSRLLPETAWKEETLLKAFEQMAGNILNAGKLSLTGTTPNGQHFKAVPRSIEMVSDTKASINGEDLGPAGPLDQQAHIGEFWIPQKGFFAVGQAYFEPFKPTLHHLITHIQTRLN